VRAGVLGRDQALAAWRAGVRLFGRSEHQPDGEAVLAMALEHGVSAHDAQFLVVAGDLGVPLVTADRRLRTACPALTRSLTGFVRA